MYQPSFKKYLISSICGTMFGLLLIFFISGSSSSESSIMILIVFVIIMLSVSIVCTLGFPAFKFSLVKLGNENTYLRVLLAGFLSTVVPTFIASIVFGIFFEGSIEIRGVFYAWLFMLPLSILFLLPSAFMYWRWVKNA